MLQLQDLKLGNTLSQLQIVADEVIGDEDRQFRRFLPAMASGARAAAGHWDFLAPARVIDQLLEGDAFPRGSDAQGKTRLRRVAVARLALDFFQVEDPLPPSVTSLYPDLFRRLTKFVATGVGERYDEDYFAKDVRYALGLTIPCGALQFDLKYRIGPKLILRDVSKTKSSHTAFAYLKSRGWGRWYNEHLDLRAMREFNPDGWTAHCARMAEMLELNSDALGIVGVGWFYDPVVAENSPGLAYIQQTQLKYGAFRVRIGTEPHHIQNAIFRSAVRRKLYEEGKYLPTGYMLAWPRRAIIAWARRLKIDPSVAFAASEPAARPRPIVSLPKTVSAGDFSHAADQRAVP
jgi:hypothetical protein